MEEVVLLFGSNFKDKEIHIDKAIDSIASEFKIIKKSSKYLSTSWGYDSANDFINIAVSIVCNCSPLKLIEQTKVIENNMGRKRIKGNYYVDRIIDIDIIFYGNKQIELPELIIPHPRFHLRKFCLLPLAEIMPDKIVPGKNKTILELLQQCKDSGKVTCMNGKI